MSEEGMDGVPQFGALSFEADKVDLPSAVLQRLRQAKKEAERSDDSLIFPPSLCVPALVSKDDFPTRLQNGYRALVSLILKK